MWTVEIIIQAEIRLTVFKSDKEDGKYKYFRKKVTIIELEARIG
jgi:hypothetical protein